MPGGVCGSLKSFAVLASLCFSHDNGRLAGSASGIGAYARRSGRCSTERFNGLKTPAAGS